MVSYLTSGGLKSILSRKSLRPTYNHIVLAQAPTPLSPTHHSPHCDRRRQRAQTPRSLPAEGVPTCAPLSKAGWASSWQPIFARVSCHASVDSFSPMMMPAEVLTRFGRPECFSSIPMCRFRYAHAFLEVWPGPWSDTLLNRLDCHRARSSVT